MALAASAAARSLPERAIESLLGEWCRRAVGAPVGETLCKLDTILIDVGKDTFPQDQYKYKILFGTDNKLTQ